MHLGEKNNGKHEKGLQVVFDEFEKLILEAFSTQGRNLLTVLTWKPASNSGGSAWP